MDEIVKLVYRISYLPGYRDRTGEELDKRKISYTPARGNNDFFLAVLPFEGADELRGLEGISSVKENIGSEN